MRWLLTVRVICGLAPRNSDKFLADGWVEHDANEIWQTTLDVCRAVMDELAENFRGIGITNQRETVVDMTKTGMPIANAIVWQTGARRIYGANRRGRARIWCAENRPVARPIFFGQQNCLVAGQCARCARGRKPVNWLSARWIAGLSAIDRRKMHATDVTNAARTSIFNIYTHDWDDELLALFNVLREILPTVHDNVPDFGISADGVLAADLPICGMAGDQQAAVPGQACFEAGMIKSTYGTGVLCWQIPAHKLLPRKTGF